MNADRAADVLMAYRLEQQKEGAPVAKTPNRRRRHGGGHEEGAKSTVAAGGTGPIGEDAASHPHIPDGGGLPDRKRKRVGGELHKPKVGKRRGAPAPDSRAGEENCLGLELNDSKKRLADLDDQWRASKRQRKDPSVTRKHVAEPVRIHRKLRNAPTFLPFPTPTVAAEPRLHIWLWGFGENSQFGLGEDGPKIILCPKLHKWCEEFVGAGEGVQMVVLGGLHTLLIDRSGRVWSWGINDAGALGRITVDDADTGRPGVLQSLVDEGFKAVFLAAGDSINLAIDGAGQLRCWGSFRSVEGPVGFDSRETKDTIQILPVGLPEFRWLRFSMGACGSNHVLALTVDGWIYTWGTNDYGQLGRKLLQRRRDPREALRPMRIFLRGGKRAVLVAAGGLNSFAVDEDGCLFAWGDNCMSQTGVGILEGGDEQKILVPAKVLSLCPAALGNDARVIQIAAADDHTLFLISDGRVFGCGRSDRMALGLPEHLRGEALPGLKETTRVRRPTLLTFPPPPSVADKNPTIKDDHGSYPPTNPMAFIAVAGWHSLAISRAGSLYSWGTATTAQLALFDMLKIKNKKGDEEVVRAHRLAAERPEKVRFPDSTKWEVKSASTNTTYGIFTAVKKADLVALAAGRGL